MTETNLTEGEYRVGVTFNPAGDPQVTEIKEAAAALIDMIEAFGNDGRCTSLAMTAIEDGALWAVKSITQPAR